MKASSVTVSGLLGEHPRIVDGNLELAVDDFLARMQQHVEQFQPGFAAYQQVRNRFYELFTTEALQNVAPPA